MGGRDARDDNAISHHTDAALYPPLAWPTVYHLVVVIKQFVTTTRRRTAAEYDMSISADKNGAGPKSPAPVFCVLKWGSRGSSSMLVAGAVR